MPKLAGNKWAAKRGLVDDDCSTLAMFWIVYLSYHQAIPLTVESCLLDDVYMFVVSQDSTNKLVFMGGHDWSLSMSCECCFLHAAWVQ